MAAHALEVLKDHGRRVLYKHFPDQHGRCIPGARMALEFCRCCEVPCEVQSVVCLMRNEQAVREDVWPFQGTDRPYKDGTLGSAVLVLGVQGPGMKPEEMAIHVVPVIDGKILDMTLDEVTRPPLAQVLIRAPLKGEWVSGPVQDGADIGYALVEDDRYKGTSYWRKFWWMGGAGAVAELISLR